ncbi:MAG: alpha/beta hydrolase [Thermoplasmata archaeon]|nr:alpha/beta hydrolase [Thermoplasmata archaeon]
MTDHEPALLDIRLENLLELPDGRIVEWEAIGHGEPLLWIEGGPGLPAHLARPDVALIADRFRCHLVNAPGCGRTSPPRDPADYGLDGHVQFFEEVRLALGLPPVTVMGHSWGGLVGVSYAATVPAAVRRLVVIDGYLGDSSVDSAVASAERERALDRVRDRDWFAAALAGWVDDDPEATEAEQCARFSPCWPLYFADPESGAGRDHIERIRREIRQNMDVLRAWDPEPPLDLGLALGRIACPTLVIVGQHDFVCGPVWNRPIAAGIPGAEYREITGVGHLPQYEAPDEFRRILFDWLERAP